MPAIITRVELWKTERLVPRERGPRTHSQEQIDQIAVRLREFGFLWPIMVNGECATRGETIGHERAPVTTRGHDVRLR